MKPRYMQNYVVRFWVVLKEKGIRYLFAFLINHIFAKPICRCYQNRNRNTVRYNGENLALFFHEYNHTWLNERMIEIPIFRHILDRQNNSSRILEVGNVMSNYFDMDYDIVDKYETIERVIKVDLLNFNSQVKYDLIISISTLEHIGYDEGPEKEPEKLLDAVEKLKSLLAPGGELYVSVPMGENPYLDDFLRNDRIRLKKHVNYLRKGQTLWEPVDFEAISHAKSNAPYFWGNAIVILKWKNNLM